MNSFQTATRAADSYSQLQSHGLRYSRALRDIGRAMDAAETAGSAAGRTAAGKSLKSYLDDLKKELGLQRARVKELYKRVVDAAVALGRGSGRTCQSPGPRIPGDKSFVVYRAPDLSGTYRYVGISRDFARRCEEHLRAKTRSVQPFMVTLPLPYLNRQEARSVEQALLERYGIGGTLYLTPNKNLDTKQDPGYGALTLNDRNEFTGSHRAYCFGTGSPATLNRGHNGVIKGRTILLRAGLRNEGNEANRFMKRRNCGA